MTDKIERISADTLLINGDYFDKRKAEAPIHNMRFPFPVYVSHISIADALKQKATRLVTGFDGLRWKTKGGTRRKYAALIPDYRYAWHGGKDGPLPVGTIHSYWSINPSKCDVLSVVEDSDSTKRWENVTSFLIHEYPAGVGVCEFNNEG